MLKEMDKECQSDIYRIYTPFGKRPYGYGYGNLGIV
jgi:hypothetical protein